MFCVQRSSVGSLVSKAVRQKKNCSGVEVENGTKRKITLITSNLHKCKVFE